MPTEIKPCVMIGWDGATFDLLLPWTKQGLLPNLAKMLERGCARPLRSIIPPVSPAAWVSIMTGMNPGKHGVLEFKEFDATDYAPLKSVLINSTHFAGSTILDLLSERGLRVCSLQIPMTYPVWPINGLMLAGIPNPDDSKAYCYPPDRDFGALLPSLGRRKMSYEELYEHETYHIRKLTEIFCQVAKERYDLFFIYFRECDDFHHLYWRLLGEDCPGFDAAERARIGNPILAIYQVLDAELGRLFEALPGANFLLISDHGGTAIGRRRFYLNGWLEKQGYLKRQRTLKGSLERVAFRVARLIKPLVPQHVRVNLQDQHPGLVRAWVQARNSIHAVNWKQSRAFAVLMYFPTAGVQLNVRGREKQGSVEPGPEFERLRDEIIEQLKSVVDPVTHRPIVREVYRREEMFSGPYLSRIPDIVLHIDSAAVVRGELSSHVWGETPLGDYQDFSGDHDLNGIFLAVGPDIRQGKFLPEASILDVAPSLLCGLGQPVPENMDGRILKEIFREEFLAEHPPAATGAPDVVARTGENVYSPEEEEAIRERLESLGYLGG